jgi:hypothetical protein
MITQDNYYQDKEHVTNSMLGWLKRSPAYFQSQLDSQSGPTEAMTFGSAFHCMILEKDKFEDLYYVMPKLDKRTKAGKEEFAKHTELAEDKIVITTQQYSKILAMEEAIKNNKTMSNLFTMNDSVSETVNVWEEKVQCDDGKNYTVKCKSLIDLRIDSEDLVVDLKTTTSVAAFTSSIRKFGYDRQAAYYLRGLQANGHVSQDARFVFAVVEKEAPFEIAMFELDASVMEVANTEIDNLLKTYQQCKVENFYPKMYEQFDGTLNLVTLSSEDIYR